MKKSTKLAVALVVGVAVILAGALMVSSRADDNPASTDGIPSASGPLLVRDDSRRLSQGTEAVFVEFLDFECEACLAVHPLIEDLRNQYGDRVSFVVRYVPLHANSVNAILAAEAAADQGQFEAMYQLLFETVEDEWGHRETSQRETFFEYAQELGLDMERFEEVFDDPETLDRIEQSLSDAEAFGVTGTPTFFLDGERLNPETAADLENSLNAALDD